MLTIGFNLIPSLTPFQNRGSLVLPLDLGVFLILRPLNTKDALSKKEVGILVKPPMGTERQREGGMRDQMRECTTIKCLNH